MLDENDLITVVIPSLGASHLAETLDPLLSIDLVSMIIIVLPPDTEFNYWNDRVKIINSNEGGQVAQRAFGIKLALTKFLLLMDDDISVSSDVILNMYNFCLNKENAAVAPVLCDNETGLPRVIGISPQKRFLYRYVFGLRNSGSFNSATIALSFVPDSDMKPQKVDWLPGGVSMSLTKNAISYNYFTGIPGKAFSEDILMSFLRTKQNQVEHYILPDNFAFTDFPKHRWQ